MRDPALARLYWALARTDAETRDALKQSIGLGKLLPFAAVLDFYGSHICIRSGRVVVPGGPGAEPGWKDLVGASPESPAEFVPRLLAKDKGWLAAYFDALSRVNQTQQAHFTEAHRLKRFYEAFRAPDASADAARPVFRPAPGLLLLVTRLQWEPNGRASRPGKSGGVEADSPPEDRFQNYPRLGKAGQHGNHPEQLVEAMFAISRADTELGPLQAYLMLSELDRRRSPEKRLSPQTVLLLASKFAQFSNQYLIFSEFPDLSDASITRFLSVAEAIDKISNHTFEATPWGPFRPASGFGKFWRVKGKFER